MTPLTPGTVVADRYRLDAPLGRGGMAEVWSARDERLARPVAVKVLVDELATKEDFRARFAREARLAARLAHPNVVAVFDTGEHDGRPFLVMECLPGETLADRIADGPLPSAVVRRLGMQVLAALDAAHAAGVLHRDIKPANILLAADGRAKVADFGIAKLADPAGAAGPPGSGDWGDRTATNVLIGTPAYLAPERVEGADATPASDLYALGVVLYEALTGDRPFVGATAATIALAAQAGAPALASVRSDVDPALAAAVDQAMAADPARRFATAADMAGALRRARTPGAVARARRPTTRPGGRARRILAPAPVLGLLAVLLLGAAFFVWTASRPGAPRQASEAAAASTALGDELRALAGRLDAPHDGRRAPDAAAALRAVADALDRGDSGAASDAEALADRIRTWRREATLGRTATARALELLARVAPSS